MIQQHLNFPSRQLQLSIGSHILSQASPWPQPQAASQTALIACDRAVEHHIPEIQSGLSAAGWNPQILVLTGSEGLKDISQIYPLYAELMQRGLQRRSLLVAVGGGTIGDALGFVAATYLRGIPWVNVPSTLLGQVDSGLGGKTGINHSAGKNLIGAIYQPEAVVCELDFLKGLSLRDRVSGLGEMLKYGLIADANFWQWLQTHQEGILNHNTEILAEAVARSLRIKAQYVAADEADLNGIRAELNFGHTFGHALEAITGYGYLRHGEAVLYGMQMATRLSENAGQLPSEQAEHIIKTLSAFALPDLPALNAEALSQALLQDKKNEGAEVACIVLTQIGKATRQKFPVESLLPYFYA